MEDMAVSNEKITTSKFWRGRRVFVTGVTGIVGSWLVKELLEREAYIVTLVQDADPQSELYRNGDIQRVSVVNGSLEDIWKLERAINFYEIDTVFHLGAQTIVNCTYLNTIFPHLGFQYAEEPLLSVMGRT